MWFFVPIPNADAVRSRDENFKVVMVARDLEKPWAVDFLPDKSPLIT